MILVDLRDEHYARHAAPSRERWRGGIIPFTTRRACDKRRSRLARRDALPARTPIAFGLHHTKNIRPLIPLGRTYRFDIQVTSWGISGAVKRARVVVDVGAAHPGFEVKCEGFDVAWLVGGRMATGMNRLEPLGGLPFSVAEEPDVRGLLHRPETNHVWRDHR